MDTNEELSDNDDSLDSKNVENEQVSILLKSDDDSKNKPLNPEEYIVEYAAVGNDDDNSIILSEPKREYFDCRDDDTAIPSYQSLEKLQGYRAKYFEYRNNVECFASDEESEESLKCMDDNKSDNASQVNRRERLANNLSSPERFKPNAALTGSNKEGSQHLLPSNRTRSLQYRSKDISMQGTHDNVMKSFANMILNDESSKAADNNIEHRASPERFLVSDFDSEQENEYLVPIPFSKTSLSISDSSNDSIEFPEMPHSKPCKFKLCKSLICSNIASPYDSYNGTSPKSIQSISDMPNNSNSNAFYRSVMAVSNTPPSLHKKKSNKKLPPIQELSDSSKSKIRHMKLSRSLELPSSSDDNYEKEIPKSSLSIPSRISARIRHAISESNLYNPSKYASNLVKTSPNTSKNYRTYKSSRALRSSSSSETSNDEDMKKNISKKKGYRKKRKMFPFGSDDKEFYTEPYEQDIASVSDFAGFSKQGTEDSFEPVKSESEKNDYNIISPALLDSEIFEPNRPSRKRTVSCNTTSDTDKSDAEIKIKKKLKWNN